MCLTSTFFSDCDNDEFKKKNEPIEKLGKKKSQDKNDLKNTRNIRAKVNTRTWTEEARTITRNKRTNKKQGKQITKSREKNMNEIVRKHVKKIQRKLINYNAEKKKENMYIKLKTD